MHELFKYYKDMEKKVQSPVKKFVVEKGGNPRGKAVTKEDIKQALRDITEWFKAHAKTYYAKLATIKGAPEEEIKKLQTTFGATLSVQTLLSMHNGGLQLLDTYITLPINEITATLAGMKGNAKWKPTLIPIAKNVDNELLCVDSTAGKESGVVVWGEEGVSEVLAENMGAYLEMIRDSLLLKKLEYDEGLGLIFILDPKK